MKHDLPQSLIDAIKNNTLVPFVGAGISMGIKDNKDNLIFKSWTNSLLDAVEILNYEQKTKEATAIKALLDLPDVDYLETASKIHKYLNSNWNKYLTQTFDKKSENINQSSLQIPKEILKINNLVITTNYDDVLKWACENKDDLIEWDKKALYGQVESLKQNPSKQSIWYLHGKISNPDDIVFTKESYEETYKEDSPVIKIFQTHLLTKSFIFCGFSLDDPYIKIQLEKLKSIFGTNLSKHYMIIQKGQKKDFSYLGDIQFLEVEDYDKDYLALLKEINQQKNSNPILPIQYSQQTILKSKKIFNVPFESKQNDVVGIEGKLEEVHEKLSNSKKLSIGQVAKFEGMGGLGKTQLAVEYAHKYKDTYLNGVLWLTMDQDIDEQLITLGRTHNLVNQNLDIKEQLDGIKYQLKSFENMLLIYDNINEQKDIEQEFLPKSITNKILITTRNPIQGFESIPLETLNFENSKKLLEIESSKTVLESENKFVEEICEKLDGLPLALEMAGAYIKYLDLSWEKYVELYTKQHLELLNKSKLPESFTKHENNIVNTLTISQKIIDEIPKLKEIINLLSYGANEPIDDELITKLLACDETDIIEAIKIGIKLKYIKESSQGYTIHRLLKEVWKTQEKIESSFIDSVAKNLADYIYEIKDEFLNLSKIEIANLFSQQWSNYLANNDTKAILIAYRAYLDYYKGNYDKALEIVKEAEERVEKKDSKEYAEILAYQGSLNSRLGNKTIAKKFFTESFEMRKKLYPKQDHPDIAISLNNLGTAWNHKHDFDKALDFYSQSFEMWERLYPNQNNPHIANSLHNLGTVWNDMNDFDKALEFHNLSFEMRKRLYPNQDHPDIANSLICLGIIIYNKSAINKALDFYTQSFEMRKRLYSNQNHPDIIKSMFRFTRILCLNPLKRKNGLEILKKYKKIVTKNEDKLEIERLLKKHDNIGRDKSKRKKR
ncbi:SIR2 family protein [Aliarcobacter butzleri]|uniref:SIR2 family protein n=1 Tax=Aliarcobacter butzleri TaxID=28197 RepID=UPI00263E9A70|nr:SIR2 family protein [Aliarcobacter butzleri]MDN5102359.1 SIR2 family protein [Aliarcobacter butzleri]